MQAWSPGRLADLVVPPRCAACSAPCDGGAGLCTRCERALREAPPLLDPGPPGVRLAVSACEYDGVGRALVHGLKFGRRLKLGGIAAEVIVRACPPGELCGTVVPVPAAPWRWRWRGFDPAEEIALELARRSGLPYASCLRRSSGPRQVGRARTARLADPPRVRASGPVPTRVVLVDDVRTTGATLGACASALRERGCGRIVAVTLARSR